MTYTCSCGKLHYSIDHFFQIHGDYLGRTPEHRIQAPFLPNGKLYQPDRVKDTEPFPVLSWKWVCKQCGNFNTTDNPATHKSNCAFVKYLEFRETEPFKGGAKFVKTSPSGTTATKPTEEKKPDKKPEPPKYEPTESDKKKINNYRHELLNILIKYELDLADDPNANLIIAQFKEERKDRSFGWFWEELKRIDEELGEDEGNLTQWPMWRKYATYCQQWEELEGGGSAVYQPEKKRRIIDWYLLSKLSFSYYLKLLELRDKNDKPRLDPSKKYLLSDLLILVPKKKKAKPKPQNAPLAQQIERFQKEYYERLVKYIDLDTPPYFPENEVDRIGKQEKYWKESSWRNYLENSQETQNDQGTFIDLQQRINTLKTVFAIVVIERLIEKRNKLELEGFIKNYDQSPERDIYEQEKYSEKIKAILEGVNRPSSPDPSEFLWEKPKYYDELFTYKERTEAEEMLFSSLTAEQWNELDEESGLKNGLLELRNFPNLKRLKIKVARPYLNAPLIKKIDLSATADDLEALDLSQCEDLTDLILGKKPELKRMDVRWTLLKKLNLKNTQLQPKHYDTLDFKIRMKTVGADLPVRVAGENDREYDERIYKSGEIIWPFEGFNGDEDLITLPRANITFFIPWIKYGKDWSNISPQFRINPELIQPWYDNKFDYETAKTWMDIFGTDPEAVKTARFCAWMRDIKKKNAEWTLNHGNLEELRAEYIKWVEENTVLEG